MNTFILVIHVLAAGAVLARALMIANRMHKSRWRDYLPVAALAVGALAALLAPAYGVAVPASWACYGVGVAAWVCRCRRSGLANLEVHNAHH